MNHIINTMTDIINEIMAVLPLYKEIVACFIAASLLSLFVGWMISRSSAKRKLRKTIDGWETRYHALEQSAAADTENLEEQLQSHANDAKTLQATNRVLTDSLKKNDTSIQKARAEAIELNRQHAETQERLQRIIQQKDRELVELGNRINQAQENSSRQGSTHANSSATSMLNGRANGLQETDINHADTVAINPAELFDATVQMSASDFAKKHGSTSAGDRGGSDEMLEDTADLSGMMEEDLEESTVALDDEALAFAQRSYTASRND